MRKAAREESEKGRWDETEERRNDYLDDYAGVNDALAFDRIVVATNRHCVSAPPPPPPPLVAAITHIIYASASDA